MASARFALTTIGCLLVLLATCAHARELLALPPNRVDTVEIDNKTSHPVNCTVTYNATFLKVRRRVRVYLSVLVFVYSWW